MEENTTTPATDSMNDFLDDWHGDRETKAPAKPVELAKVVDLPSKQEDTPPAEKEKIFLSADMSAEMLIGSLNMTQTLTFGAIIKRKKRNRFDDKELARAEEIYDKISEGLMKRQELNDDDFDLWMRYRRLEEAREALPFTDDEEEQLKKPLALLIKQNGYDIPPGIGLTIAAAQVLAPRLVDAFFE